MATYKQRPYSRHVGSGRHSPDIASPKITQTPVHHPVAHSSLAQTTPSQLQSQSHSHSHGLSHPDDDILDNASDHEWTSIRHTISARAKARQEQYYRNQEQQRAQEWHFVLGQHQKASASVSARNITRKIKDIHSSDEYEDPVASPVASISTHQQDQQTPIRFETDLEGESSHFGFSDLASDLDGDESEGQGWSHDDDEIASSSSTSIYGANTKHLDQHQQKSFSSPYSNASTTSLSNLAHPSFALGHNDNPGVGFHLQNKMPFHDGSGYFGAVLSGDSDQGGWESSTSDVSSIFSSYSRKIAKRHSLSPRTRPISSPEFGSVLQNMATLQGQLNHPHLHPYHHHYPHTHQSMMTKDKRSDSNMVSTVASASLYPSTRASKPHRQRFHGQIKLQNCSIYESEMEDIEGMVIDIPSRVGWLQIFEQALNVFNNNQDDLDSLNPIKALAQSPFVDDLDPNAAIGVSKGSTTTPPVPRSDTDDSTDVDGAKERAHIPSPSTDLALLQTPTSPSGSISSTVKSLSSQVQMKHLRQKMSASSLDTLQRLQKRQRSDMAYNSSLLASPHISRDPMHVDFIPTIVDSVSDTTSISSLGRHTPTRSTSTMTGSSYYPSDRDTNVLATVISTLRRFRDHVKSNLLHPEFDQESHYLSGLGFEGDLGMEWAIGTSSSNSTEDASKGETSPAIVIEDLDTNINDHKSKGRFFGRALPSGFSSGASTPALSTTTRTPSRVSSSTNVRRIGSECGLESLSLRHEDWSKGRGERIHRYSHRYDEGRPSLVD
ncbi:hypothetical protein BG003_004517 [Podila horticola]|nr:hypothetical protein BG003_004517 [Podila horticola]